MLAKIDSLVLDSSPNKNFATEDFVKSTVIELKEELGGQDDEDVENQGLQDLEVKVINLQEDVSSVESSIEELSDKLKVSQEEVPPPPPVDSGESSIQTKEQVQELEAKIGSMAEELASIKSICVELESKLSDQTPIDQESNELDFVEEDNEEDKEEDYVDIYQASTGNSEKDNSDIDTTETQETNSSALSAVADEDLDNDQNDALNKDKIIIIDNESKTLEEWLFLYKVSSDDHLRGLIHSNPELQEHLN